MQLYNMQPTVACFYNFKNFNMHITNNFNMHIANNFNMHITIKKCETCFLVDLDWYRNFIITLDTFFYIYVNLSEFK